MKARLPQNVIEMAELRDRVTVFRDREHAGKVLAGMLTRYEGSRAILSPYRRGESLSPPSWQRGSAFGWSWQS